MTDQRKCTPYLVEGDTITLCLRSLLDARNHGGDATLSGTYLSHAAPLGPAAGSFVMLEVNEAQGYDTDGADGVLMIPVADIAWALIIQEGKRKVKSITEVLGQEVTEGTSGRG